MSQKGYIHLYGNCLYSRVKFLVDRSSYNARSTIFPIVFNLLIVILSSFCRWIQALCLRKPAVRNRKINFVLVLWKLNSEKRNLAFSASWARELIFVHRDFMIGEV